ncbi:TusE/DsrC/DsvC family sulfur relay protein [Pseudomonas sp. Marseille-QA0892]
MSALVVEGQPIPLDPEGYLVNLTDWSPTVAGLLAEQSGITLTDDHWEILNLLRNFYAEFQLSPSTRPLVKYVTLKLGPDKGKSAYLNRLFDGAPAKLGAKLAGLPKPTNCI